MDVEQPKPPILQDNLDEGPVLAKMAPQIGAFGEFANPEQLFKAYNELRVTFTQKTQELSELKKQQGIASVASDKQPDVIDKEQIISEYLSSVASKQTAPAVIGTGANFLAKLPDPTRTMLDAGKLAKDFFKSKGS